MARYAKINDGVVENVLEVHFTNSHEFSGCIPLNDLPVQIGDAFVDGVFYRGDTEIKSVQEQLADAEAKAEAEKQETFAILRGEVE